MCRSDNQEQRLNHLCDKNAELNDKFNIVLAHVERIFGEVPGRLVSRDLEYKRDCALQHNDLLWRVIELEEFISKMDNYAELDKALVAVERDVDNLMKHNKVASNKPLQGEIGNWKCSNSNCRICV